MKFDWQAYLDGSMDPRERDRASALLGKTVELRHELEGGKEFLRQLRRVGLQESVPTDEIQREFRSHLAESRARSQRKRLIPIGIAVTGAIAAAVWFGIVVDPMRLNTTPTQETISVSDPRTAAQWIRSETALPAPPIDLSPAAKMVMARHGRGWACFDYQVGATSYYLYMREGAGPFRQMPFTPGPAGTRLYQAKGVGWEQNGLAYYLRGPLPETRTLLATRAIHQISRQRKT